MGSGRLLELWRYPAKSMVGERMTGAEIGTLGVVGDRGWAVRDERRGGIRGSKKIAGLMTLSARYLSPPDGSIPPPPIEITLADGTRVRSSDRDVDRLLSDALGQEVTLWPLQPPSDLDHYRRGSPDTEDVLTELRAIFGRTEDEPLPDLSGMPPEIFEFESPPGTYFDAYPIHLLTTASMHALRRRLPEAEIDVRRFRPNLLVEWPTPAPTGDAEGTDRPEAGAEFPEMGWIGRHLRVGEAELEVVTACPRCVMISRAVAELPVDRSILRTVVREADQNLGVYARVSRAGSVQEGDRVELLD